MKNRRPTFFGTKRPNPANGGPRFPGRFARLATKYTRRNFFEAVESFSKLKILVVGDTIFDRYSYLKVQGLTSKNKIISGRFLHEETQCGGALAAFRHVKEFTRHVKFISLVGTESWAEKRLRAQVAPGEDCVIRDAGFTTIIKQRFVEPLVEGKEMSKLFAVNFIDAQPPAPAAQKKSLSAIRREIKKADAVLLDFGHGCCSRKSANSSGIRAVPRAQLPDQQQ